MQSGQNMYKQAENPLYSETGEKNLWTIDPVFLNTPVTVFFKFFLFSYSGRVIQGGLFVVVVYLYLPLSQ